MQSLAYVHLMLVVPTNLSSFGIRELGSNNEGNNGFRPSLKPTERTN